MPTDLEAIGEDVQRAACNPRCVHVFPDRRQVAPIELHEALPSQCLDGFLIRVRFIIGVGKAESTPLVPQPGFVVFQLADVDQALPLPSGPLRECTIVVIDALAKPCASERDQAELVHEDALVVSDLISGWSWHVVVIDW